MELLPDQEMFTISADTRRERRNCYGNSGYEPSCANYLKLFCLTYTVGKCRKPKINSVLIAMLIPSSMHAGVAACFLL